MDGDMVLAHAMQNNRSVMRPTFRSMGDVLVGILDIEPTEDEMAQGIVDAITEEPTQMMILSNSDMLYGASYLADKTVLNAVAHVVGEEFYILHSSLHELIILPKNSEYTPEALKEMVMEVNRTQLSAEDFLSDNIYQYNARIQELSMYDGVLHKEQGQVQAKPESKRIAGR